MSKITILALRVMEYPKVETIETGLKPMQEFVGGYIECLPIGENIDLVCNEEGKFTEKPNRPIFDGQDIVYGDCFVARANPLTGEYISLTDEDIQKYSEVFRVMCLS